MAEPPIRPSPPKPAAGKPGTRLWLVKWLLLVVVVLLVVAALLGPSMSNA